MDYSQANGHKKRGSGQLLRLIDITEEELKGFYTFAKARGIKNPFEYLRKVEAYPTA